MGELAASVEGCEVVLRYEDGAEFSPALSEALAELAQAMYEQNVGEAEVAGFGLRIGDLGLAGTQPMTTGVVSCWGFEAGGHCSWYSSDGSSGGGPKGPRSCTIHSKEAK